MGFSSGGGDRFGATEGSLRSKVRKIAQSLPKDHTKLTSRGWKNITHPNNHSNTTTYEKDGVKINHDKGIAGKPGFQGKDHYHIFNPNRTGKTDYYFDKNGNVVPKGSKESHILPGG